jgi:hypothetical protein
MSNIGLLPNFVHVYFRVESSLSLMMSNWLLVYRNGTVMDGSLKHLNEDHSAATL